jgi:hypothetical protein
VVIHFWMSILRRRPLYLWLLPRWEADSSRETAVRKGSGKNGGKTRLEGSVGNSWCR